MGFTEKDVVKVIETSLEFNDYNKILQILQQINPNIFENKTLQNKFKEILAHLYVYSLNDLKDRLKDFLGIYYLGNPKKQSWFCSSNFRKNYNNLGAIHKKEALQQIIKIINNQADKKSIPIGEFIETPHGVGCPIRVFWYRAKEGIFIVDVYTKQNINNFYSQVERGYKKRGNYSGFVFLEDFISV